MREGVNGDDRLRALRTLKDIYRYAFRELLDEIGHWLVLGIARCPA